MQGEETYIERSVYGMTCIKRGHTHKYPQLPLSISKIVFCVFSLTSGTLRRSVDERLSGLKGSNLRPTAVVFGRVPLKGILLFFPLVLTGVRTSSSLKIL
jgi:hypothetical protein